MSKLSKLYVEIHFKQDSIPNILAGPLTHKSKQNIKKLFKDIINEELSGFEEGSEIEAVLNTLKNQLRQKIDQL